jgi:hypothetical protein
MAKGGKRPGAGRPPGARNIRTVQAVQAAEATGETPLEYMLRVMRDGSAEIARRDEMAKAAAPFVHAKLTSVDSQVSANLDGPVTFTWLPSS